MLFGSYLQLHVPFHVNIETIIFEQTTLQQNVATLILAIRLKK